MNRCLSNYRFFSKKEHTLHLEKSDGKIAKPDMCGTEAWKQLSNDRKVEMCKLVETSPKNSFSNAWIHGLLSVRMHALLWDWIM